MGYPIDSFDITDLVVQREVNLTQTNSALTNSSMVYFDNTGNMVEFPVINLTTGGTISTITLSNVTTGITAIISGASTFPSGTVLDIFCDAAYSASTQVSANYSGMFYFAENISNSVCITLSPTASTTIDMVTQWLQPSSVETVLAYAENFSITETRNQRQQTINLLDKYANSRHILQSVTYSFSMDKLFYNNWFLHESDDETYRIKWQTNSSVTDIDQVTCYLNGCKFNTITWTQADNENVKENIQGVACRRIEG